MPKQPQAPRQSQSLRSPLQHGPGECERDVDRDPATRQWTSRAQGQQGQVYQQDVPARRLGHSCAVKLRDGFGGEQLVWRAGIFDTTGSPIRGPQSRFHEQGRNGG